MELRITEPINRQTWLQYLQAKADPDLLKMMEEAEDLLLGAASVRWIYRILDREQVPAEGISIEKHLEGCRQAALLAVSCGSEVDALIRRYEIRDMAMALLLDTGASALAEQAADLAEQEIRTRLTQETADKSPDTDSGGDRPGQTSFCTSRFSPGYGDYPVRYQREILNLVDAPRRIGLTVTAGNMMVPHKSITAVMGIADHPVKGRLATCDECILREKCQLRPLGKHC